MMRRLSSFKSTPKSLVEHISIDQEFYGYENEGAVFPEDNEEEDEIDTVDNEIPYVAPTNLTVTLTTMDVVSDNEIIDSDEGEISCDSDCDSPTQQKKGLRRFFCMPVRSMKAMRSFRRPKKKQQKGLLMED